jgi:Rhodopirellula transposase DDE domain
MAFDFQQTYRPDIEPLWRQDYQSLSEKERRRFAALEAITRGHGGPRSIAQVLGCAPQPVTDGMRELQPLPDDPAGSRVRKPGGGRTKTEVTHAALPQPVHETLTNHTAGDPRRQHVVWTAVTPQAMAPSLHAPSVCVAPRLVRRMRDGLGCARRQRAQGLPGGASPQRGAQCRHLAQLLHEFLAAGNPVLSIDTKQKECLGTLSRDGNVYGHRARKAFAHDVPSLASGGIMPHGLSDLARHQGGMHGGRSRDTTACACESVRVLWHADGQRWSPKASALWLLGDGGGSHSCRTQLCKADLQGAVNDLAVPIRVAHDPAYGSTCTPLERRLCSHVTSACQGVLVDALHMVLGLMHKTKTQQGLTVTGRVLDKLSHGGRTVSEAFKKNMPIVFEKLLPKWNYRALPQ